MAKKATITSAITICFCISLIAVSGCSKAPDNLVIYSSRKSQLLDPIIAAYKAQTGQTITIHTDKAGPLIARLKAEADHPQADLLITVDAGTLWYAKQSDLLQPFLPATISKNIPANRRDSANYWTALSLRARSIVYHKDRVEKKDLPDYEALSDKKWENRLLLRTSKKVYNQSLIAMFIGEYGEAKTSRMIKGWVANLAEPVFTSDTNLIKAIAAGKGDIGIVNTYYLGRLQQENPNYPVAMHWPNQDSLGVHINISGAGIIKGAPHAKAAQSFLAWLTSSEAQKIFADANLEFPANPTVEKHPVIEAWGPFKESQHSLADAGRLQKEAILLMEKNGYE